MSDWDAVANKFVGAFGDAVHEIRKSVPTEGIAERAMEAMASVTPSGRTMPVQTDGGLVQLPVEGLMGIVNEINARQRAAIEELASRVGEMAGLSDGSRPGLVREDGDRLLVRIEWFVLSVSKEVALKVASLGCIP